MHQTRIILFPIHFLSRWSATLACTLLFTGTAFGQASGNCDWIGGTNNDWHTAANWDCDQHNSVPGADDAVTIAPGGTVEVLLGADAEAWSFELGIDDGSTPHPNDHELRTTADDVTLTVGDGGVVVRQTGFMQFGQSLVPFGIGARPALRANLDTTGLVLVHGRFWIANATISTNVVVDRPGIGGARGYLQARGWNIVYGKVEVVSGFLQPVVPGGHHGTPAPHLRIVGQDLYVAEGSSVQLFADPGTFVAPAIAVEDGHFDHRGSLTTTSSPDAPASPIEIDAVVVNSGLIRTRLARPPGLRFSGPVGAIHQNIGEIEIGLVQFGSDTEDDAVDGFGFQIASGRSLHNTGEVIIHRLRSAEGTLSNTGGGTVTDEIEVNGPETYILGFAGDQAVEIQVVDAGLDPIERLTMTWHGEDHPDAALHPHMAGTNHWWALASTTSGGAPASGEMNMSLPGLTLDVPRICRYVPSPAGWDCLLTDNSTTRPKVYGLTALSEWAIAGYPDLLFYDRFQD